jgi:prefoldin alpha subunit
MTKEKPTKEASDKEAKQRELYMQAQMLEQATQQLQQRKTVLEKQLTEFRALKENLEGISKEKADSKMFSPLGSGVFVNSEIKDTSKVLVNIGSGIAIEKPVKDATKMVEKQIEELNKVQVELEKELSNNMGSLTKLHQELQAGHVHGPNCNH